MSPPYTNSSMRGDVCGVRFACLLLRRLNLFIAAARSLAALCTRVARSTWPSGNLSSKNEQTTVLRWPLCPLIKVGLLVDLSLMQHSDSGRPIVEHWKQWFDKSSTSSLARFVGCVRHNFRPSGPFPPFFFLNPTYSLVRLRFCGRSGRAAA